MPKSGDDWAGLVDDIPAASRSVLQPFVEAIARDDSLPSPRPRPDKQAAETDLWLLCRACTSACLVTLRLHPDLDSRSLARLAADDPTFRTGNGPPSSRTSSRPSRSAPTGRHSIRPGWCEPTPLR